MDDQTYSGFDNWWAEVQRLAFAHNADINQGDPDYFRDLYNQGMTPIQALRHR